MKKTLLIAALLLGTFAASAQTSKKLVADETQLIETKTSIKLVTSNETIFKDVVRIMSSAMKGYTVKFLTDKRTLEVYKEYTIPFKFDLKPEVLEYVSELNQR